MMMIIQKTKHYPLLYDIFLSSNDEKPYCEIIPWKLQTWITQETRFDLCISGIPSLDMWLRKYSSVYSLVVAMCTMNGKKGIVAVRIMAKYKLQFQD